MTGLSDVVRAVRPLEGIMADVVGAAEGELRAVLEALDMSSPEATRDALLEAYPAIVESYGDAAGAATAEWYEQMRLGYVPAGQYVAEVPEWLLHEKVEGTARWAAGKLWGDDPESVLDNLLGSMVRQIEDVSRDTVTASTKADPLATGWYRIAHADSCDFCVMLHGRGAVYRRENADFAAHDNCRCKAAPSWDPSAPEVDVRLYEPSKRMGRLRQRATDPSLSPRERRAAQQQLDDHRRNIKSYIEANAPDLEAARAELL